MRVYFLPISHMMAHPDLFLELQVNQNTYSSHVAISVSSPCNKGILRRETAHIMILFRNNLSGFVVIP
jgi:hypothetical protein